ncbi:MAG: hypothetical protein JXO22_16705 [Phycisphaerae bacterium]|nr:hypothetical protein [Phycisphaerae bacterium]
MFRKRLQWFVALLTLVALVVVARLVDVQVLQAAEYEALAARILTQAPRYLPAPRGDILDRFGRPLVSDEASANISMHYAVLTFSDRYRYLSAVAREMRKRGTYPDTMSTREIVEELQKDVVLTWRRLEDLTGTPVTEFVARAEEIRSRIERIRQGVEARTGTKQSIVEEYAFHPIIENADRELVLAVRMELEQYPWVRVEPATQRVAHDVDALAHLVGRQGQASAERIADDSFADDELRRLRPGDVCGITGVERVGEAVLRGVRGRVVEDFDRVVLDRVEPVHGQDVYLTIDVDLQREALRRLGEAIEASVSPSGGSVVILDVATREVLALVSYPTYHYDTFSENYESLRQDTRRLPTRFRAVATAYPPGSTCKAITVVGGLADHKIAPGDHITCDGYLLPDKRDRFRCWIMNQYGLTHGPQNAELAVKNSCNIYFFKLGGRLGPEGLCKWFGEFGFGRSAGTGLIEESRGVVPTDTWLARYRPDMPLPQPSDAWNWAIGQGEVSATPLQVANVAATVASGRWEPVRLASGADGRWLGDVDEPPIGIDEAALRVLRRGMWRVVNDMTPGDRGTGYKAALDSGEWELCGKTGSAQAQPHVVNCKYVMEWADGRRETVVATTREDALAMFDEPKPEIVGWRSNERYPEILPDGRLPAHAWFMGYTQKKGTALGARPTGRSYAIGVLVEFGGSGGSVAAPLAKEIMEWMLARDDGAGMQD